MHGHGWGGEAAITLNPVDRLKLIANYSYLELRVTPDAMDPTMGQQIEGASPRHQVSFRSMLNLPAGFRFDLFFRFIDRLESAGAPVAATPHYASADASLAWTGWKRLEISVVGQSLLESRHLEFPGGTEVERSIYGKLAAWF